ncbi:MAG: fibronectin type III domain-containing protein [Gammaproteobacteria bacterium]
MNANIKPAAHLVLPRRANSRIFRLALAPALALALLAAPGGAVAQGISFTLSPESGLADINGSQKVRITPSFDSASDYPNAPTTLMLLPRTPVVDVREVAIDLAQLQTDTATARTAYDTAKTAVDTAKTAVATAQTAAEIAYEALAANKNDATLQGVANTVRTALVDAKNTLFQKEAELRMAASVVEEAVRTYFQSAYASGTVRTWNSGTVGTDPRFPLGFVRLTGAQYATFGEDFSLSSGRFTLHPDGRIDPSFIDVARVASSQFTAEKTAILGIYAVVGDKKYNRASEGSVAEVTVTFNAPTPTPPAPVSPHSQRIELYLVGANSPHRIGNTDWQLKKFSTHRQVPVSFEARIVDIASGGRVNITSPVHVRFPPLQENLSGPTAYHVTSIANTTYQPAPTSLSILRNTLGTRTNAFVLLPLLPGRYSLPAPVLVNASGVPITPAYEMTGVEIEVVQTDLVLGDHSLELLDVQENRRLVESHASGGLAAKFIDTAASGGVRIKITVDNPDENCFTENRGQARICRPIGQVTLSRVDATSTAGSAAINDFLKPELDGSFTSVSGDSLTYKVSATTTHVVNKADSSGYSVPVHVRRDELVEGNERFQFKFEMLGTALEEGESPPSVSGTASIDAHGSVELQAEASPVGEDGVSAVTGRLVLSGANTGISIGVGGSVRYGNGDNSIVLLFSDSNRDGVLRGDELSASDTWTSTAVRTQILTAGNVPAGLQNEQFGSFDLEIGTPEHTIAFANAGLALSVPESDYGNGLLTVTITPPLSATFSRAQFAVDSINGSATNGGAFPDLQVFTAAQLQRVHVPAGATHVTFTMKQVRDDLLVEPTENFKLVLRPLSDQPYAIDASNDEVTVTLVDGDITTFTVEPVVGQLARYGQPYRLTGRLSAALQVSGSAVLAIGHSGGSESFTFPDSNNDGYLSGTELLASVVVTPLAADGSTRYTFDSLTIPDGLDAADFHFPKAAEAGRPGLWNSDFLLVAEKIAPRFDNVSSIQSSERALTTRNSPATRVLDAATAALTAVVNVRLSHDANVDATAVVTAWYDPDGAGGNAARSVSKTLTIDAAEDATALQPVTFAPADFVALGITDDYILNQAKVVTTTVALDAVTSVKRDEGELLFSSASVNGPDIILVDDESGRATMRVFLVDADNRRIDRLEVGKRTDAYVMVEISGPELGSSNQVGDDRAFPVSKTLAVDILLGYRADLLTRSDLGNPSIPPLVVIPAGASRGVSDRALRITPVKSGSFDFIVRNIAPNNLGVFTAASHERVAHSVFAVAGNAPPKRLVTLDVGAVSLAEGDTSLSAAVSVLDAATGLAAAITRNGSTEAATLHYVLASAPSSPGASDGASAGDLSGASPFAAGSVSIAADATTVNITVPAITDDSDAEGDEHFTLTLTSVVDSNGLPLVAGGTTVASIGLANSVARFTIAANDGAPTVSGSALTASEVVVLKEDLRRYETAEVRSGEIIIRRPADVDGVIRGRINATDVTTEGPSDFVFDKNTFEIPANEDSTVVLVTALADDLTEVHETFEATITLTEPANGVLPPATAPEVIIVDGDRPVKLQLAGQTLSGAEGDLIEVKVALNSESGATPLREHPVSFTLTPSFGSGATAAAADDFIITLLDSGSQVTRKAASVAELTATGVLNPDQTTTSVFFLVAIDGDVEGAETLTFTLSLADFADISDAAERAARVALNTHDGAITLGDAVTASGSIAASTAGAPNVLVITPTTITRAYGAAAPSEYAFTVAAQAGSEFTAATTGGTADTDSTQFFTTNPLIISLPDGVDGTEAGKYQFKFAASPAYAAGIDDRYDFVLANDVVYEITPKEVTFTGANVDKIYDGTLFVPLYAPATGTFARSVVSLAGAFASGDIETGDKVDVRGGVYASKGVGTAIAITGFGLFGADAANYSLAAASAATGAITAREISNLGFVVEPHAPVNDYSTITPSIDSTQTSADGVLPAELAGFRAGFLVNATYMPAPTTGGLVWPVRVTVSGAGCSSGGSAVDCGLTDSGDFTAANYQIKSGVTTADTSGIIGATPEVATALTDENIRDPSGRSASVFWSASTTSGVPGGTLKYYVRWRTAAIAADTSATPPVVAVAAGAWQNAAGDSEFGEDVGAALRYTIAGLTPGSAYNVEVQAENQFGADGRSGFTPSITVTPLGKASPPEVDRLTNVSTTTELEAHLQVVNDGGSAVTHFLARWRRADAPANGPWTPSVGGLAVPAGDVSDLSATFTFGGDPNPLSAGVRYDVQIAQRTAFGDSDWSELLAATPTKALPAAAVPGAIPYLSAVAVRDRSNHWVGQASWGHPAENSAPITGYQVQWAEDGGSFPTSVEDVGANVFQHVNSGSPIAYKVRVRARNAEGTGPWSSEAFVTIPSNPSLLTPVYLDVVRMSIRDGGMDFVYGGRPAPNAGGTARFRWRRVDTPGGYLNANFRNNMPELGKVVNLNSPRSVSATLEIRDLENGVPHLLEYWIPITADRAGKLKSYLQRYTRYQDDQAERPITLPSGQTSSDVCQSDLDKTHRLFYASLSLEEYREKYPCITTYAFEKIGDRNFPVFVDAAGNDVARNPDGSLPASALHPKLPTGRMAVTDLSAPRITYQLRDLELRLRLVFTPNPVLFASTPSIRLGTDFLTMDVTWSAPSDGTPTGYEVRWRPRKTHKDDDTRDATTKLSNWQLAKLPATSAAYTITEYAELGNADRSLRQIRYEVQVRARTATKEGAWSAARRFTPVDPRLTGVRITALGDAAPVAVKPRFSGNTLAYSALLPNAATAVTITPQSPPDITYSWNMIGQTATAITPGSASAAIPLGNPGASVVIVVVGSGLVGGSIADDAHYTYTLTRAADRAGRPGNVTTEIDDRQITLKWEAPSTDGGDPISGYQVRWRVAAVEDEKPGLAQGAQRRSAWLSGVDGRKLGNVLETTITGLKDGIVYELQVSALNNGGIGLWTLEGTTATPGIFDGYDVDASGAVDVNDAYFAARYLIGLRGDALVAGIADSLTTAQAIEIGKQISTGEGLAKYDVDGNGFTTAADGIMILRYFLGVTSGPALTHGQSDAEPAAVAAEIAKFTQ